MKAAKVIVAGGEQAAFAEGFGVLATVNGIGDLISSIVVGALWSAVSPAAGFLYAAIFTGIGAALIYFFTPQPSVK